MKFRMTYHSFRATGVILMAFMSTLLLGQLSPGKLSKAHSKLEGLSNCTECHTIGAKIAEDKCLSCHKELQSRIAARKGYHVSREVKGKDCISCHSDHHGLNFDMVRFDKKTFNHNFTGYELKGGHKIIDCAKCHKPDNIASATLKKKPDTFLGLDTKCLSCHDDYHQKTMSNDCASCHNFDKFKPAVNFNHGKTSFALLGAHKNVDCVLCHKMETRNGKDFQHFADVTAKNCNNCHKDVHRGSFGTNCKSCHTETSFHTIAAGSGFNHSITGYTLEGKHARIDCKACHKNSFSGGNGHFKEYKGKEPFACITCHEDKHEGKFGTNCQDCHNQNTFRISNTKHLTSFDHDNTNFILKGKHEKVDCKACHKQDLTTALAHDKCASCHTDYHNGDFVAKVDRFPDCASCHTESGFSPSTFTLEQHEKASFALDGAHIATPCISCHFKEEKWVFSKMGTACVDCHNDIHKDYMDEKYYGNNSCASCHQTESWSMINFDHSQTEFALEGKHKTTKCAECHIERSSGLMVQKFRDLGTACVCCHENVHGTQFEEAGKTECKRCHGFENWEPSGFDHSKTNFKLEGGHEGLACIKCHKEAWVEGKMKTIYKIEKYACIDCHQ
ncbi:MAG: cytochrome c family protein [Saprospiraceae bacterium]|nr:cytochrome c family protein [Saprospiraceae bacterium]